MKPQQQTAAFERETAKLAYQYWMEEGCPNDRAAQHWERAERELQQRLGPSSADRNPPGGIPDDTSASGKLG